MSKPLYYIGTSVVLGIGAYAAYRYYRRLKFMIDDEGFEDATKLEDNRVRKILVLGLEKVGKSTILQRIIKQAKFSSGDSNNIKSETIPTDGLCIIPMEYEDYTFYFTEIGGKEENRKHWTKFLQDNDLLMLVVDATDIHNLPTAAKEFKVVVGDDRISNVPIIIVVNKYHLPGAMSVSEVSQAIDIPSIESYRHKVTVIGVKVNSPHQPEDPSICKLKENILHLIL